MAQDMLHALQALRNQIIDNFSVAMPDQLKTKVVLAHRDEIWWCIVYGNDNQPIWKTAKGCDTAELALRKMLVSSSDLLFDKFHQNGFVLDR